MALKRFTGLVVAMLVAGLAGGALADPVNTDADGLAIKGYDTVAYFTEGKPVEGKADYEHRWQDATWRFSSASHREMFAMDPERYAPRYGGHCAGAMAQGRLWTIDPEAWVIVDDKLFLNFRKSGRDRMAADPEPVIQKADANWERLRHVE